MKYKERMSISINEDESRNIISNGNKKAMLFIKLYLRSKVCHVVVTVACWDFLACRLYVTVAVKRESLIQDL